MHRVGLPSHFGTGNKFLQTKELSAVFRFFCSAQVQYSGHCQQRAYIWPPCWSTSFKTQSSLKNKGPWTRRWAQSTWMLTCVGWRFWSAITKLLEDTGGGTQFIWGVLESGPLISRFSLCFSTWNTQRKMGHHLWVLPLLAKPLCLLLASVCKVSYLMRGQEPP